MTLEQLRIFMMVADLEHVTRAAERLNLTQSAVSGAIQTLENTHQVALFDRVGRGIRLTDEGRLLREKAVAIMAAVQDAEATLGDLSGLKLGALRIVASQTIASNWLPRFVMAFATAHPGIDLTIEVGNTEQCLDAVRRGTCDLGYVEGALEGDLARIEETLVATDTLVLICAPSHPWAQALPRDPVRAFASQGWVMRERGSGTRSSFEEALRRKGGNPGALRVVMEFSTNEAICSAIEHSDCLTVIPGLVAGPLIEARRLVELSFDIGTRPFRQIRNSDRHLSRAARVFAEMVAQAS